MEAFLADVRYAVRGLLNARGFTAVALITLAVGVGANVAMFSVVNSVLLRPLPFRDPQRLVALSEFDPRGKAFPGPTLSYPDFLDIRAHNKNLDGVAAYGHSDVTLASGGQAVHIQGETVSASLFSLLGVHAAFGRTFLDDEERSNQHLAVVGDSFWRSHFNSDRGVIGSTVNLNGRAFTIVGVMPQGFQFPVRAEATDVWLTFTPNELLPTSHANLQLREDHFLDAIARVKPGVTLEQVNAELTSVGQALASEYPITNNNTAIAARPELEYLVGDTRTSLLMLFAAVGLVLLIASANVANLLLARSTGRTREMALRVAIGASPSRIIRQLVTESIVLSMAGAALGVVAAAGTLSGILQLYPTNLPRVQEVGIDLRVLAFTIGVASLTGILFGLAPALHAARPNLAEAMKEGGRTSTAGPRQNRLRSALVIAETALGLMLVAGAGLLVRSFQHLSRSDLGFNPGHLLTANFNLSDTRYNADQEDRFVSSLLDRLKALPGVSGATGALPLPLYNDNFYANFELAEHPVPKQNQPLSGFYVVSPGFFEAMQIPLLNGRTFDERDRRNSTPVVIVTRAFAEKYFHGENPIGKRITIEGSEAQRENYRTREIIGVVGDIRRSNLRLAPTPAYYVPLPQLMWGPPTLVIRTAADPANVTEEIRKTVAAMDPDIALYDVRTMDDRMALDLGLARFQTVLLGLFAGIALLLTTVGLYGVMAYTVGQRIHEIGVRQALGATKSHVLRLVIARGMMLTLTGIGIGIIAALEMARLAESLLYEVPSHDPVSYLIASAALAAVGLLASYIPALRATRVDPLVVLRYH